jgi:predicted permease
MLCVEYGGDEKFMAQITFLTTLVSVITIPVIAVLL